MDKKNLIEMRYKSATDIHRALVCLGWSESTAAKFLNSILDADVAEVVHCEECKFYNGHFEECDNMSAPTWHTDMLPNDYCSYGERGVSDWEKLHSSKLQASDG